MITKHSPRLLPILLAFALAGCSSVKTNVNEGHITARTFSFLNTAARPTPSYAETRKEIHAMIQQALINNFASKGVSNVPSGGDITVAYLVIVGNNASTTSMNEYFGYTDEAATLVDRAHKEQTGSNERAYVESGTLVIDILNPQTSKLLQRRSTHAEILRNLSPDTRARRLQTLVDQALADVQIAH